MKAQLRVRRLTLSHDAHGHHSDRNLKADLVDCLRPRRTVERLCQQKLHVAALSHRVRESRVGGLLSEPPHQMRGGGGDQLIYK